MNRWATGSAPGSGCVRTGTLAAACCVARSLADADADADTDADTDADADADAEGCPKPCFSSCTESACASRLVFSRSTSRSNGASVELEAALAEAREETAGSGEAAGRGGASDSDRYARIAAEARIDSLPLRCAVGIAAGADSARRVGSPESSTLSRWKSAARAAVISQTFFRPNPRNPPRSNVLVCRITASAPRSCLTVASASAMVHAR
jgi:hypothetical protein